MQIFEIFLKMRYFFYGIMVLMLTISGCSKPRQPTIPYIPPDGIIVAFGDSLTFGVGAPIDKSYPAILETLIQRKVINEGVPGLETENGDKTILNLIQQYHPALIIVCLGGNDMLRRRSEDIIAKNIENMVITALGNNVPIILIAVPKPGLSISPPDFYEKIAKKYHIPVDTDSLYELETQNKYKSDMIHLNANGYQKLAENIAILLKKTNAVF